MAIGKNNRTDKELYLLKALLYLLLYNGTTTEGGKRKGKRGKGLFFVSGESNPTQVSPKIRVNMM